MVTRAEFIQAIRDFKKKYRGKLKDLLDEDNSPRALKAFWSNPIIHEYLSRPSVTFVDQHPELHDSKSKKEHDETDHYELKIYQYLPEEVVYRKKDILSPGFYTSGTDRHTKVFNALLNSLCQGANDINIDGPMDIYRIAPLATRMFLKPKKAEGFPRFLLHANWKDDHASTLLTILDKSTGRALLTLLINSWQGESYYKFIKERFLKEQIFWLGFQSSPEAQIDAIASMKEYLNATFSINMDEPLSSEINLTNDAEKATFKTDSKGPISPNIETVYVFDNAKKMLQISHTPKTPFIDASLNLQKEMSDQNCALYSFNFIQGITHLLQKPEEADRVYTLARSVESNPEALEKLINIFQHDLKAYLPCYYDITSKEAKSLAEREAFHLQQRWEIGRQSILIRHPLKPIEASQSSAANSPLTAEHPKADATPQNTASESKLSFFASPPQIDKPKETQQNEQASMASPS